MNGQGMDYSTTTTCNKQQQQIFQVAKGPISTCTTTTATTIPTTIRLSRHNTATAEVEQCPQTSTHEYLYKSNDIWCGR